MMRRGLKLGWLLIQALLALWYLTSSASDRQVIFLFALALSFPAGFIAPLIIVPACAAIESAFGLDLWGPGNVGIWLGCVGAGYWQWFVAMPVSARFRRAKSNAPAAGGGHEGGRVD